MNRRDFTGAALAAMAGAAAPARASTGWPTMPVRVIVPSAAGGPFDPIARFLAERLSGEYGQPFVVENKSGVTGMIGMDVVAKTTDGHALGVIFLPHVLLPALLPNVPYDITRDVAPVSQTHWTYNVLVVNPKLPVTDMNSLIALARSRPGRLTLASGGNGSPAHVMGEYFKQLTGSYILHVPYRGPLAALQELVGGQTDMMFASAAAVIPHVQAGRLRTIAVTSGTRLEALPQVPTFAELGFSRFDVRDWSGIVAAPSLPREMIPRLNASIVKALAEPATASRFAKMGLYVHTQSPEGFGQFIRQEKERWGEIVKSAGIRIEH